MKTKKKKLSNYEYFIKADTSKYTGEWIAISNEKIVSHGKDAEKVYKLARKKVKKADISLSKVPEPGVLIMKFSKEQQGLPLNDYFPLSN